jgi:type III secretory pathway component EscS
MTADERERQVVLSAGDMLADMVGVLVAMVNAGTRLTDEQTVLVRRAILAWHRLRALTS